MIGVAGQDRHGSVELFGNEDTHQLVRPGHRAEVDRRVGFVAKRRIKAIGAANCNHHVTLAAVSELTDPRRKGFAVKGTSPLIEQDQECTFRQGLLQSCRLLPLAGVGVSGAALRHFDHAPEIQPDRGPGPREAVQVAGRNILLRSGFQPSHGKEADPHVHSARVGASLRA